MCNNCSTCRVHRYIYTMYMYSCIIPCARAHKHSTYTCIYISPPCVSLNTYTAHACILYMYVCITCTVRYQLTISKEPNAAAQLRSVWPTSSMKFTSNPDNMEHQLSCAQSSLGRHKYAGTHVHVYTLYMYMLWESGSDPTELQKCSSVQIVCDVHSHVFHAKETQHTAHSANLSRIVHVNVHACI